MGQELPPIWRADQAAVEATTPNPHVRSIYMAIRSSIQ
jgi:hypothetical protein